MGPFNGSLGTAGDQDTHTHSDERCRDDTAIIISAPLRVLVALLLWRSPVKHEREVPLVRPVERDDLVERAAVEGTRFVKANMGGGLEVVLGKLLEKTIDAHCSRGGDSAGVAEEGGWWARRVYQRERGRVVN